MNLQKSLYSIAFVTIIIAGCKTTPPNQTTTTPTTSEKPTLDCGTQSPIYTADIKPILDQHCNSCYGERGAAGYSFLSMDDIKRAVKNGALLGSIKWEKGFDHMPARAAKLDDTTIKKIECWINSGMN